MPAPMTTTFLAAAAVFAILGLVVPAAAFVGLALGWQAVIFWNVGNGPR